MADETHDILLDDSGDIIVSDDGDITVAHSIRQEIYIALRWFLGEWRFGPTLGFPYFEDVFVKNANLAKIKRDVKNTLMRIDGVNSVEGITIDVNRKERTASVTFTAVTDEDTYNEEVILNGN